MAEREPTTIPAVSILNRAALAFGYLSRATREKENRIN